MERSIPRMRELDDIFMGRVLHRYSSIARGGGDPQGRRGDRRRADPGANAPKLVRASTCAHEAGSVLVDVSIDQGGCFETSRPTTHATRPTRSTAWSTTAWPTCPRARRAHVDGAAHATRHSAGAASSDYRPAAPYPTPAHGLSGSRQA
jgi:hypothetical protein